ncbi:YobA family protein [Alkalihalophilus marmarensis]|jgi:hypothetical protein|uniref:DUF3221 domain-containing protein n=1 Tax=Alkalihalophilus marmarensis DSM 21297 TaxID=1188261 RepID=U6SSQ4_9BACI|nr:hypothetical protein [Alkalihalophilus marmarensis]ERN53925.1 hypothetical protein A33I_09360 [Alkalihalophilus marmarensis DSM 21297]MCM3491182.1 YobA family protein [Alkalihalophilus marmarensis]
MKYLLRFLLLVSLTLIGCSPDASQANNADLEAEIIDINEDDTIIVVVIDARSQGYRDYINNKIKLGIPSDYSIDGFQEGQLISVWLNGLIDTEPPSGSATKIKVH